MFYLNRYMMPLLVMMMMMMMMMMNHIMPRYIHLVTEF